MSDLEHRIGFIGAGNMGGAIIAGLIAAGMCGPENIFFYDANRDHLQLMKKRYGITALKSNADVVETVDIVVFAVKPQAMAKVLSELTSGHVFANIIDRKLILSIAAGIRMATFEEHIYRDLDAGRQARLPILRAMPNTPALVRAGMTGLCANHHATAKDVAMVRHLLSAVGSIIECTEIEIDAVTAVSGSGPAYCFYLAEAMIEAGIALGFAPDVAAELTVKTLKGAAALLESRNESPETLRENVTSPGGTTEAAIRVLEDHGVKQSLVSAVMAAAKRSMELSA
jgi:pyrroline-5-carboxylate reductase